MTGAAGFIGSHLTEALLGKGETVVGVDCFTDYYPRGLKASNLSGAVKSPRFSLVEADLASAELAPLLKDVDVVFHLAAQPGVRSSWGSSFSHYVRDNIVATQRLLEAAKGLSLKRFVYASSSSVYGDSERSPTPEDTVPRPRSPYGATKLASEHLCRVYLVNYGLPVVVLRYFTVYGPRQRPDMAFHRFIDGVLRGEPIEVYGDGSQERDYTFVDDTVAATMMAAEARPGSEYNVATQRVYSLNEAIAMIESVAGRRAKVSYSPVQRGDVVRTSADISRIKGDLGFAPRVGLRDGIERQVEWQRLGSPGAPRPTQD